MYKVRVDFNNATRTGVKLSSLITEDDLREQNIELFEGQVLFLYDIDIDDEGVRDDIIVRGLVSFSEEHECWVGNFSWADISTASRLLRSA